MGKGLTCSGGRRGKGGQNKGRKLWLLLQKSVMMDVGQEVMA